VVGDGGGGSGDEEETGAERRVTQRAQEVAQRARRTEGDTGAEGGG